MREYHDLYLKTDVLLLADVFENFRDMALEHFKVDPCHYVTAPAMFFDALLKMSDVELELISDPEMYDFIERAKRGGVSSIMKWYAKANNKHMGDRYDPSKLRATSFTRTRIRSTAGRCCNRCRSAGFDGSTRLKR